MGYIEDFQSQYKDRIAFDFYGCWLWEGRLTRSGYACVDIDSRTYRAHKYLWEKVKGKVPVGLELDHLCRVRRCINPDHLEPVTHAENCRRTQPLRGTCKNGHEYKESTVYLYKGKQRICRICAVKRAKLQALVRTARRVLYGVY